MPPILKRAFENIWDLSPVSDLPAQYPKEFEYQKIECKKIVNEAGAIHPQDKKVVWFVIELTQSIDVGKEKGSLIPQTRSASGAALTTD